jgi:hypothetical protein
MKPSFSLEHSLEISHEAVGARGGLVGHSIDVTENRIWCKPCGCALVGMAGTRL